MKINTYNLVLIISLIYIVLMHFTFVTGNTENTDTSSHIIKIQGLVKSKKQ